MNRNIQIFAGLAAAVAIGALIWVFALGGGEKDVSEPREAAVEGDSSATSTQEAAAPPDEGAEAPDVEPETPAQSQEAALPDDSEAGPESEAGGEAASGLIAPSFDVVRVEPNGDVVIAGRAMPGANVTVLDNNKPLGSVEADGRGD